MLWLYADLFPVGAPSAPFALCTVARNGFALCSPVDAIRAALPPATECLRLFGFIHTGLLEPLQKALDRLD